MAFIQLSLIGAPAVIICGNTITMTCYWQRETIEYHLSGIDHRLRIEAVLEKLKTVTPVIETAVPALSDPEEQVVIHLPPSGKYSQGELF
jgi:hypothetical protein